MPTLTDMKIPVPKKPATMVASIIALAGLLTAVVTVITFWDTYGWVTRAAYAKDEAQEPTSKQMSSIQMSLDSINSKLDRNRDEWKCDEWEEELIVKRAQRRQAETDPNATDVDKIRLDVEVEDLEEHRKERDCSRFTQ